MRTWSFPVGRLHGVELRLHFSFFFLLIFLLLTETDGSQPVLRSLAVAGMILGSVMVHELGHALAGRSGPAPRAILLFPIGGVPVADPAHAPQAPRQLAREVGVALAGPFTNLAIAFTASVLLLWAYPELRLWERPYVTTQNLARSFVWINIGLGLLNLLPGFPLDAGRAARALMAQQSNYLAATRRAVTLGQMAAMGLILVGIWNAWLMMAGFFLFLAAQMEDRTMIFHSVMESVRMEEVMLTDFAILSPADTLEDALAKATHSLQDDFPVIRGNDMVGVINRQKIVAALRNEGNSYVQGVMTRGFAVAQRTETLASAVRKIISRNVTIIPVVDENRLVGIVTLQNLMRSIALLAESRRLKQD